MINIKSKLLFFTAFPPPNTGQTIASNLIFNTLHNFGFQVERINTSDPSKLSRKTFSVSYVCHLILCYMRLLKILNVEKIHTVYVVYSSTKSGLIRDALSVLFIKYGTFRRVRLIAHLHSGNYGLNFNKGAFKYLFKFVLDHTNKLIFLSESLNHIANQFPKNRSYYLTNMIDQNIICTKKEVEVKLFKKAQVFKEFQLVYLSNMIPEKGFQDLDMAMRILKNNDRDVCYNVKYIGGWTSEKLKNIFESNCEQGSRVRSEVVGPVYDRKILKQIFLDADLFILPTYYPIEAQPLSIIEALSSGTPVIATFHAAIPEMITHGENGILVEPKNPEAIAEAIVALSNRETWLQYAQSARKRYCLNFSNEVLQDNLVQIFRE